MLTHPTLDQMPALGLGRMASAYRDLADQNNANHLSRDEWLGLMLDREAAMRVDKRRTNKLAAAKLRFSDACIENIDFAARRGLDRHHKPGSFAWLDRSPEYARLTCAPPSKAPHRRRWYNTMPDEGGINPSSSKPSVHETGSRPPVSSKLAVMSREKRSFPKSGTHPSKCRQMRLQTNRSSAVRLHRYLFLPPRPRLRR